MFSNRLKTLSLVAMLIASFVATPVAEAAVADTIPFRGRLLSSPTTAAANQTFSIRFSIWSDADFDSGTDLSAGALQGAAWEEVTSVTTDTQGFFTIEVGSSTALPVFDFDSHKYLQAEVKDPSDPDTSYFVLDTLPTNSSIDRKSLSATPYALNAARVDGREVGLNAGMIPYLDENGKLDRGLVTDDSWLDPVADLTAMNAIASPSDGDVVFVQSEARIYTYDGSSWVKTGGDLDSDLAALTTRVTDNEADIASNLSAIQSNDTDIAAAVADIASNLAAIQANDGDIADNVADIAANLAAIQANDTDIAANAAAITAETTARESAITALQADVNQNEADADTAIAANATAIAALDADTYSQSEVDSLVSTAIQGLSWKAPVATVAAISTTYTSPSGGDTVYVEGTGEIYTYSTDESDWVKTGADFFQEATTAIAGIVELAEDGEIAANKAVQSNDSRLAQIATNTSNISTNAGLLTSLQADVDQNEADADAAIAAETTARSAAITALQADVDQNEADADTAIAANLTSINNMQNLFSAGFDVYILP